MRCKHCRGYLNPGVELHEHVGKWTCNLCGQHNDLPPPPPPYGHGMPPQQGRGGMFGGLWGGAPPQQVPQAPLPTQRPELQTAEVEYVLSGQEALEYSSAIHDGRTLVYAAPCGSS